VYQPRRSLWAAQPRARIFIGAARMLLCTAASAMLSVAALGQNRNGGFPDRYRVVESKDSHSDLGGLRRNYRLINIIGFLVTSAAEAPAMLERESDRLSSRVLAGDDTRAVRTDQKSNRSIQRMHVRFGSDQYLSSLRATRKSTRVGCGTEFYRSKCALVSQAMRSSPCDYPCTDELACSSSAACRGGTQMP
jgi:hypothetical protein